ncbi:hypothetical protein WJX74_002002 [Apatococcus lobatus]
MIRKMPPDLGSWPLKVHRQPLSKARSPAELDLSRPPPKSPVSVQKYLAAKAALEKSGLPTVAAHLRTSRMAMGLPVELESSQHHHKNDLPVEQESSQPHHNK